jgi:hypothetical protein
MSFACAGGGVPIKEEGRMTRHGGVVPLILRGGSESEREEYERERRCNEDKANEIHLLCGINDCPRPASVRLVRDGTISGKIQALTMTIASGNNGSCSSSSLSIGTIAELR